MSKRFANLSERLSADIPNNPNRQPVDDEDDTTAEAEGDGQTTKDKPMADTVAVEETAEYKAGFKASADRMGAVFASEHYAGREATAHKLLAKEMSAEDILDVLETTAKAEPSSTGAESVDLEEAARAEMKDALAETGNSDLEASGGGNPGKSDKDALSVWDKPIANVFHTRGK